MKIELLGHEAEISHLFPYTRELPLTTGKHRIVDEGISVWFEFKGSVASVLSFAISIEAKDYTEEEFIKLVKKEGEVELGNIIQRYEEGKIRNANRETQKENLNRITADLGDKLDIPYNLITR